MRFLFEKFGLSDQYDTQASFMSKVNSGLNAIQNVLLLFENIDFVVETTPFRKYIFTRLLIVKLLKCDNAVLFYRLNVTYIKITNITFSLHEI